MERPRWIMPSGVKNFGSGKDHVQKALAQKKKDKGAGNLEEQFEKEAFEKLKEQPPPPTLIFTLRPGRSWLQPL